MTTTNARPEILPTLPGKVNGVVSMNPLRVQCQQCGKIDDHTTLGLKNPTSNLVIILSKIHFHGRGNWPDGTNPRLCRTCRLARGCTCEGCEWDRKAEREAQRAARPQEASA